MDDIDADGAWKDLLEYAPHMVFGFFFEEIEDLDQAEPLRSLEQELRGLSGDAHIGKVIVDKLLEGKTTAGDRRLFHLQLNSLSRRPNRMPTRRSSHYGYKYEIRLPRSGSSTRQCLPSQWHYGTFWRLAALGREHLRLWNVEPLAEGRG